jgi:hypothetical protein
MLLAELVIQRSPARLEQAKVARFAQYAGGVAHGTFE